MAAGMGMTRHGDGSWRRRDLLRAGAASLVLLEGMTAARAQEAPRIGLPVSLFPDAGPLLNAQLGAHFRGRMAATALDRVDDSPAVIAGLRAGRFKFGQVLALELLRDTLAAGEPLVSVATFARPPPSLYGRARNLPAEPARLAGRKIAVPDDVAQADGYLSLFAARHGVDPRRVPRLPIEKEAEGLGLMMEGKVDGLVVSPGMTGVITYALRERGTDQKRAGLLSYALDLFLAPLPGLSFVATRQVAESEPDLVADFVRGLLASVREITAEHEAKSDVVRNRLLAVEPPPRRDLRAFMVATVGLITPLWLMARERERPLRHDPARWTAAAEQMAKAGLGDVGPKLQDIYTNRFIDEVWRN